MVEAGDNAAAAVAIERGRALSLAQALERDRADLQRLREVGHGDLHDRYQQVSWRLRQLERVNAESE
jgi:hypothetical protein